MAGDVVMGDAKATSTSSDAPADASPENLYPMTEIADLKYKYEKTKDKAVLDKLMSFIKEKQMLAFYEQLIAEFGLTPDTKLLAELRWANEKDLEALEAKIKDAEENAGDIEVKNALLDKADFLTRIGDKKKAMEAYDVAHKKTVGVGGKMDISLTKIRIGLFFGDFKLTDKCIKTAHDELKKGGDWERKNKLKVYEGIFKMQTRDFEGSAKLFLDSVATFTATELVTFNEFIFYAVLISMIGLKRNDIAKKVISSPEILSAIHETPHMKEFLMSYYHCDYRKFMREFVHVIGLIQENRYLSWLTIKLVRQMRLNVYEQFITSYKSVTLKSMAQTFGVSPEFIDWEIYGFIAAGKLHCKIDKVNGVIESTKGAQDTKSSQYMELIKEGDNLLNKMQKLAAAIDR